MPGSGSKPIVTPRRSAYSSTGGRPLDRVAASLRRGAAPSRDDARPQRDAVAAAAPRRRRSPGRGTRSAAAAAVGRRRDERRLVLVRGIEQVAGAGFDDRAHAVRGEQHRRFRCSSRSKSLVEGIEARVVERDRDAAVAEVGQQLDRRRQAVVGEAVGVVAEVHEVLASFSETRIEWRVSEQSCATVGVRSSAPGARPAAIGNQQRQHGQAPDWPARGDGRRRRRRCTMKPSDHASSRRLRTAQATARRELAAFRGCAIIVRPTV